LTTEPGNDRPVRLAHLSDIHLTARPLGWTRADWLTKRVTGWVNLRFLGRGRRFEQADTVLMALMADIEERRPDRVLFSGDATCLGFESELFRAAELLGVDDPTMPSGLAVPGNHDYYVPAAATSGLFELYFAPWQVGERVDDAAYPFAQAVGPYWLIAVNSSTGNRRPTDATGAVGPAQRERLGRLLDRLSPGPRILVTHFPVCRKDASPENPRHCLHDLAALVEVAARGGVCLWLHGHRHEAYHLPAGRVAPFPVICTGSSTQYGLGAYNEYTLTGKQCQVRRRVLDPVRGGLLYGEVFAVELPSAARP
jgi:3',5'-cyclic AMP phosphodiesterase CpdA